MDTIYTLLGLLVFLFGLFVIGCSYVRQVRNIRNRKDPDYSWSSPTPFVGPIMFVVGLSIWQDGFALWWLLAFVLDPDTIVTVVSLPTLIPAFRQDSHNLKR